MSLSKQEIVKRARWFIIDQCYLKNDKQREIVLNELISIIYDSTKQNNKKRCNQ